MEALQLTYAADIVSGFIQQVFPFGIKCPFFIETFHNELKLYCLISMDNQHIPALIL